MPLTPSQLTPAPPTTSRPSLLHTYLRSARVIAFLYAAVAVGALLLPLPFAWREPLWLASSAVALVLGVHLAQGSTGPRWLLVCCGWLLLALALMLAFVIGDPLGLLGTVFTVPVLTLVTGKITPRTKKALVTTHVIFSGSWLGVGVVMVTLSVLGLRSEDTGIAVSLTSKCGLARHYWILAKLLIAIAIIASAFGFIHRWVVRAAERSAQVTATGGNLAAVGDLRVWLVTGFGVAVFFVAVATVLSVYKPWGKTRFAGR